MFILVQVFKISNPTPVLENPLAPSSKLGSNNGTVKTPNDQYTKRFDTK